ncbi:GNAT family N-acetyltransferase [Reinekea blandensis]|uniref:N-acetyltransferase domain-containing protein n=1 Tax=Reinekea blandensis MED297 TaxID=314283 RepID=A4BB26_9GAMM|nr:GNAT family N-acetyltransferase [Reinekea blandensis]EAR10639.1 hypothetical protein MED297_11505 [Reinekea sp. MED297] [Reinekea blandensis MED297]
MNDLSFIGFDQVDVDGLLSIVNEDALRTHLIDHPYYDRESLKAWMDEKVKVDSMPGCRVRAVFVDEELAGWCGIQPDDQGFELAIVISQRFWGIGIAIYKTLIGWAKELGHKEVLFHLLDSRPEYQALNKMASKVYKTEQLGRRFTTYCIPLER